MYKTLTPLFWAHTKFHQKKKGYIRIKIERKFIFKIQFPLMVDHKLTQILTSFRQILLATEQIMNKSKHWKFTIKVIG